MKVGVFQLLPRGQAGSDREVIEQALWEVDFAEANGFDSVWVAEHHFSGFGLASAPSVYLAAIAQRTRRVRIGYGIAVVPLHQPLRLAEEISWVDHLSAGRLLVGVGPGFSAEEFDGFGVPLAERHARLEAGFDVMRRALNESRVRPQPYTRPHPRFYWASSSEESLRKVAAEGLPMLLPSRSAAERLDRYRAIRAEAGVEADVVEREVGEAFVLHRIGADAVAEEVLAGLDALWELGLRNVIAWFHTEETPHADVRRSMHHFVEEVMPALRQRSVAGRERCPEQTPPARPPTGTGTTSSTAPPTRLC